MFTATGLRSLLNRIQHQIIKTVIPTNTIASSANTKRNAKSTWLAILDNPENMISPLPSGVIRKRETEDYKHEK